MNAVFAETRSLEEATTKIVVSTDVPDIMVGDKPVVACAVTPSSAVQKQGHELEVKLAAREPYDGCWQIHCITLTGAKPPALDNTNLLTNVVSVVPYRLWRKMVGVCRPRQCFCRYGGEFEGFQRINLFQLSFGDRSTVAGTRKFPPKSARREVQLLITAEGSEIGDTCP